MIDTLDASPTDEVLASITLEAPWYVPADARHISRLLKAGGLPRAERQPGGSYTFGFHVSLNDVTTYGGSMSS
jgi:hypothetical protein